MVEPLQTIRQRECALNTLTSCCTLRQIVETLYIPALVFSIFIFSELLRNTFTISEYR